MGEARKWLIEGHDSLEETVSAEIDCTRNHVVEVLRCLASCRLAPREVLEDAAKPGWGRLVIHRDDRGTFWTDGNPWYTARPAVQA